MKVLDLDMDFFLTDACPLALLGERPPEDCAEPYSDEQVIRFLETQCGLSRAHPVPGKIFDTDDKIPIPTSRSVRRERISCSRRC